MNSVICPTVLAHNKEEFDAQMRKVSVLANRVQIDLMDGEFASPKSVSLSKIWWPKNLKVDIHLMYQRPMDYIDLLIEKRPHMVIFHVEAMFHHMFMAARLHKEGVNVGLAILPDTPVKNIEQILNSFDHLLIFSGDLGKFGGKANLDLLKKVKEAKIHHPDIEIGWDGGVNLDNAKQLAEGGINVLNVGGAIQKADNPKEAYQKLVRSLV